MPTPNWDDLRLFLAVARAGRLVAAARTLRLDHTTVARRVASFERAMGSRLFNRTPRGSTLTEAGAKLVAFAERVEGEMLAAGVAMGDKDTSIVGPVRLSTPEAFGTYLVAPNVRRLHQQHPELRLELTPDYRPVRLANREADVAVMLNRPSRGPAVARRLADYRIGLYASQD